MRRIRIHNDIAISWQLTYKDGSAYDLEGRELTLIMHRGSKSILVEDFIVSENIIQWVFHGKDQHELGTYTVILCENRGESGMITIDTVDAFALVSNSVMEAGNEEDENPRVYGPIPIDTIVGTNKSVFWDENTSDSVKLYVNGIGMTLVKPKMVQDLADSTYRKSEVDTMLNTLDDKIDGVAEDLEELAGSVYTKTEVDNFVSQLSDDIDELAEDLSKVYTKAQIDALLRQRDLAITNLQGAVRTLQQRDVLISDVDYAALEEAGQVDPAKKYLIYEAEV